MESCCCAVDQSSSPERCPRCGQAGRAVERITLKAMLRPQALERVTALAHRFCPTPDCPVAYFGEQEVFERTDVVVPIFQKEPAGDRTVCYCLGIRERALQRELAEKGGSRSAERITALVKAGRCACEVRNPQGTCCLGNVTALTKAAKTAVTGA